MSREITIPYCPRPIWRDVIHPAMDQKKRAVLVCHRRFGKTVGCINELIKKAIQNKLRAPRYAYMAPYRNQAKRIAWEYMKYYTNAIPGMRRNESELYVEFPTQYQGSPGARIYIVGADKPDALRGEYLDGVIMDEYAQMRSELYGEIIVPALADRDGFAYFIGTPKGQNQFYERYLAALKDPTYFTCCYRADETNILSPEKMDEMKREMTDLEVRQELLCDFTASVSDVVMPIDLVTTSAARELLPEHVSGMPVVLGVDVARFGDDRTAITCRQGLWMKPPQIYHGLSVMEVVDRVILAIRAENPDAVFVDVGNMGAGVVDRLHQLNYWQVQEVAFGERAGDSDRFANLRAEMYFKCRDWMLQGGALPQESELKSELSTVEYKFSRDGKIMLESKEKLKERTGKSPDLADSAVLTFARSVVRQQDLQYVSGHEEEYDPLSGL